MGRVTRSALEPTLRILEGSSIIEALTLSALLSKGPERLCSPVHHQIPSSSGHTPETRGGNQTPEGLCLACNQFKLVATIKKQLGHFKYKSI